MSEQQSESDAERRNKLWEDRSPFYSAVGQAISLWASMEGELAEIAAKLLGTSERKAGLILYSIMNFYTWLTIIDELFALEEKFAEPKAVWGTVSHELRRLNDIRVRLAHHTVWDYPHIPKIALRPGKYDARSKSQKHSPLTEQEIVDFSQAVLDVDQKLIKLIAELGTINALPHAPLRGTLFAPPDGPKPPEDVQ